MMSNENARLGASLGEGRLYEFDLLSAQATVLESQRAGSVDAEHCGPVELMKGAERAVDVALVAGQWRQEAPEHVIQRHVVIAGDAKHLMAGVLEARHEPAGFLELLGPGALGEFAADDHQV